AAGLLGFARSGRNLVSSEANQPNGRMNTIARARLKAVWKSAVMREGLGSNRPSASTIGCRNGNTRAQPTKRFRRLPNGNRRLAGLLLLLPSMSGLMALPRFAPSVKASADTGVIKPE